MCSVLTCGTPGLASLPSQVPVREYMRQNVTGGQIDVEKVKAGVSSFL